MRPCVKPGLSAFSPPTRAPFTYTSKTPRPATAHSALRMSRAFVNLEANQLVPGAESWLRRVASSATLASAAAIHSLSYGATPATSRMRGAARRTPSAQRSHGPHPYSPITAGCSYFTPSSVAVHAASSVRSTRALPSNLPAYLRAAIKPADLSTFWPSTSTTLRPVLIAWRRSQTTVGLRQSSVPVPCRATSRPFTRTTAPLSQVKMSCASESAPDGASNAARNVTFWLSRAPCGCHIHFAPSSSAVRAGAASTVADTNATRARIHPAVMFFIVQTFPLGLFAKFCLGENIMAWAKICLADLH